MSHPSSKHARWNASLWAPLILKKGLQLSPISRAAPAAIWEWSPMGREGEAAFGDLREAWWPSGLSCKGQLRWCLHSATCKTSFLPPAWNLGREPQKGTSCSPCTVPTSRKFLIHPSRASRDPVHLFNWHNTTRAHKRGPVITPAPSPIRCPSQTAHGPSQIAPALYCAPPTMSHRIRDEGRILNLHPSCPCCGTLT